MIGRAHPDVFSCTTLITEKSLEDRREGKDPKATHLTSEADVLTALAASDGILHNVHGLPKQNREFNIGMPANLTEKSVTLNQPEPLFPVKCDVHPWMNAYVAVMSHPFWAVTDEDGAYSIENLPAGTYTVEAWHERLGTQTSQITVADGEGASADFAFAPPAGG
jgi:hypothetical protein